MPIASGPGPISIEAGARRAANLRHRLSIGRGLVSAGDSDDVTFARVKRAMNRAARDRLTEPERDWVERIELRRRRLWSSTDEFRSPIPPGGGRSDDGGVADADADAGSVGLVAQASRSASVAPVFGQLLMCLVRELEPSSCLELGTGFGISGAYQAAGLALNATGSLLTVEASPDISGIAQEGFEELGLSCARRVGMLQDELDGVTQAAAPIDFAFVDAHHDEPMTLRCFDRVSAAASAGCVAIFDDIRWSAGMRQAWRRISQDSRTVASIDARRMGICVIAEPS